MIENGARIPDMEQAYDDLMALNQNSVRSSDAVLFFASKLGCSSANVLEELSAPLPDGFLIPTTPDAQEILTYFQSKFILTLVTGGHAPFQMEKMKKAGLDCSVFSRIAIPEDSIKKPFYENFLHEFSMTPQQIWVCGDRVAMDLVPAYELGFKTIHMRWGRGKMGSSPDWVDYSISSLVELKGIIR